MDTLLDHARYASVCRKTKIVCTMGPKCWSEEMLGKLLDAGMNIARFNFSHGDHAGHLEVRNGKRDPADTAQLITTFVFTSVVSSVCQPTTLNVWR